MPNQFYVAPNNPLGNTIGDWVDRFQKRDYQDATLSQHAAALAETKRQHEVASYGRPLQPGQAPPPTLQTRQVGVQENEQMDKAAQIPEFLKRADPSVYSQKKVAFKNTYGEGATKALAPVWDVGDQIVSSSPKTTNWDLYTGLKTALPGQKDEILSNLQKYVESEDFVKLQATKPAQAAKVEELYNTAKYDKNGEGLYDNFLFKNTVTSKAQADAALANRANASDWVKVRNPDGTVGFRRASADLTKETPYLEDKPKSNIMGVGRDLVDISGDKPRLIHRAPAAERQGPAPERPEITAAREKKDARQNAMDIAKAETLILTNKSKEEVGAEVELFNQMALKPYTYQWKPGKLYGGTWEKTKLPVINKKQVMAKDIYDTATKHGMTYEDVLNQIMEKK